MIITILITYVAWTLIHEGTHAATIKFLRGDVIEFKPYPHIADGALRFAGIYYTGIFSSFEKALIAFTPRIPAAIAVFILPIAAYIGLDMMILIFLAGGVIDQIVNTMGISENSDLQKWCIGFKSNPNHWRIASAVIVLLNVIPTAIILGV